MVHAATVALHGSSSHYRRIAATRYLVAHAHLVAHLLLVHLRGRHRLSAPPARLRRRLPGGGVDAVQLLLLQQRLLRGQLLMLQRLLLLWRQRLLLLLLLLLLRQLLLLLRRHLLPLLLLRHLLPLLLRHLLQLLLLVRHLLLLLMLLLRLPRGARATRHARHSSLRQAAGRGLRYAASARRRPHGSVPHGGVPSRCCPLRLHLARGSTLLHLLGLPLLQLHNLILEPPQVHLDLVLQSIQPGHVPALDRRLVVQHPNHHLQLLHLLLKVPLTILRQQHLLHACQVVPQHFVQSSHIVEVDPPHLLDFDLLRG
mmetsp:Transcript_43104/g.71860  ORF Transcript_43104/g.71860 Transcript_43104/m.71860 type:complete len:313 (-) Transcript_43104:398-1336(-)